MSTSGLLIGSVNACTFNPWLFIPLAVITDRTLTIRLFTVVCYLGTVGALSQRQGFVPTLRENCSESCSKSHHSRVSLRRAANLIPPSKSISHRYHMVSQPPQHQQPTHTSTLQQPLHCGVPLQQNDIGVFERWIAMPPPRWPANRVSPVSYTHLTLPTIYSV